MRHRKAGRQLGRDSAHRQALYRNLVTDLLRYERIETTEAKAKEIRPIAERIVTLGRRGDLHARRLATRYVYDTRVVAHLFDEIGPRMKDRPGGYLRITKTEPRLGDGARMAVIEFVDYWNSGEPVAPPERQVARRPAVAPAARAAAPTPRAPEPVAAAEELPVAEDASAVVAEALPVAEEEPGFAEEMKEQAADQVVEAEATAMEASSDAAAEADAAQGTNVPSEPKD
jgi:large subunit ribosomal protein L17